MFGWLNRRRRHRLLAKPFSNSWRDILLRRVRHYPNIPPDLRLRLEKSVQIIANERRFEGCGGLQLTDEHRITIAGQASLLLLGVEGYYFDRVPSIIIYPESYVRPGRSMDGLIVDDDQEFAGEAWEAGPIILSWRDVVRGGADSGSGHNVVLHEFAHHLDGLDGEMGGMPPLDSRDLRRRWRDVVNVEFERLTQTVKRDELSFFDRYGATNRAEFFAVSTEHFFEDAVEFRAMHPDWYQVLSEFYCLDPAQWDST